MNTFAAKPQAVGRNCRLLFPLAGTGKGLIGALVCTLAFGNPICLGQSDQIPDNLSQKIQQLENRVRQLEQNHPATELANGTTIEGAFLQVYHDDRGKQQFFAVRVLWPNTDSHPRRVDPKDITLRVDETSRKAEKLDRRVGNMTVDHQGVRSDLNSLQPNRLITIQPHSVRGAWYVFDRIPLGSRIPKLTLRLPGLSGAEEIVINQLQAERLGMVIEQIGPRGCLGLVSISGHLTSINSQVLVDALSELANRKVVRIVIQFLPDAAIPDASLRNWLLYSAAIASEEARNAGDSLPMFPASFREIRLTNLPGVASLTDLDARVAGRVSFSLTESLSQAMQEVYQSLTPAEILQEIRHGHPAMRAAAIRGGADRLDTDQVPLLQELIQTASLDIQLAAIEGLGHFGEPAAIKTLEEIANRNSPKLSSTAIRCLATSRYSVAHQAVLRLLSNESLDRRKEFLRILADHPRPLWGHVLYEYVQSQISGITTDEVSESALRALSVLEHPQFEDLSRAILEYPQSALQPVAFELMVARNDLQHPQAVLQHALKLLENHGPSSTLEKVIRRWKPREAVPLLLKTLEAPQSRRQAITLLGVVGDLATAEELALRFPNWPADCQAETLRVLYEMRWPGYVRLASDALKSGEPQVVAKAAEGLSFIQTSAALNGLLAALSDQKQDLAFAHICNALTYFSDPPVRIAFQQLKSKTTESRRNLIVAALKQRKLRSTGIPFLRQGHSASESRLWKEAQHLFDIAIEADPELADAYAARAHVHLQLENVAAAHTDFEKATQLDDDLSLGATGIALCLIMQGNVDAGLRQLESSRARFEKENMFLYNAACVYGRAVLHYEQNANSPNSEALCQKYRRQSLVDLKRSFDAGFDDIAWAKIDPDLKSIQSLEEFRQIIKLAEEKLPAAN